MLAINLSGRGQIKYCPLALKEGVGVHVDLKVLLHDVEGNPLPKLWECREVALLLPLANPPLSLPSNYSALNVMV